MKTFNKLSERTIGFIECSSNRLQLGTDSSSETHFGDNAGPMVDTSISKPPSSLARLQRIWYARHGHELVGCSPPCTSPLCEIGISRRSVYQMTTSREQALGEGNCARVTERGKEACECMGKFQVCRQPSVRHSPLGCILTESACYEQKHPTRPDRSGE